LLPVRGLNESGGTVSEDKNNDKNDATEARAAEYVRMSTEHQKYSTENQGDIIHKYAARKGYQIVRTYTDKGRSGLNIEGRDGLAPSPSRVTFTTAKYISTTLSR